MWYLIPSDKYFHYVDVDCLNNFTSKGVINSLKRMISGHGILKSITSDNGQQHSALDLVQFARDYTFVHVTSSSRYPRCNGAAKRAVQIVSNGC